ncbi:hypothetical protein AAVH_11881 [Aphelenchoides avenae]|nr:hypothetical protein AAVH_11881 [Aphelenchus avenae]
MFCLRLLTTLVIVADVACWFDTDCGTLAADSGATHFLWDPKRGLCSISSGLAAVDFSVANQQDSKTSFYYVRDVALVVPPGSPNCPNEVQLKRMIGNLLSLNASFPEEVDPTRRTWRSECKKNESTEVTPATTIATG